MLILPQLWVDRTEEKENQMPTIHSSKKSVQAQLKFANDRLTAAQNIPTGRKLKCPKCGGKPKVKEGEPPTTTCCNEQMLDSKAREIAVANKILAAIREVARAKGVK
jgi:hypothetical protein